MSSVNSVLIADDESHLRLYIKMILKDLGFQNVLEATNGQEAVALYKEHRPSLTVLDVNMTVASGLEALQQIIEFDEEALVVMLTSMASRLTVEESIRGGASGYIRKDVPIEDIKARLRQIIEEHLGNETGPSESAPAEPAAGETA